VSRAFFCSYDDFEEVYRSATRDASDPGRMLTTTHFGTQRYRPLNRVANLVAWKAGGFDAAAFRVRNLLCHLANVALVFAIGRLLFPAPGAAAIAALLFAVHPLTNMTVAGAVVTNTLAYAFLLGAVWLFAWSLAQPSLWRLVGAALLAAMAALTYDLAMVVFPILGLMLAFSLVWPSGQHAAGRRAAGLALLAPAILIVVLRLAFAPGAMARQAENWPTPGRFFRDSVISLAALVNPVDPVLASSAFGLPTPSPQTLRAVAPWAGLLALLLAALAVWWIRRAGADRWRGRVIAESDRRGIAILATSLLAAVALNALVAKRPSETYLYLPAALLALLVGAFLERWRESRSGRIVAPAAVFFLVAAGTAATVVRNGEVARCGDTAKRILAGVPCPPPGGHRVLRFSGLGEAPATRRYGLYGFRGIDTIGDGDHSDSALTAALRLSCSNPTVAAQRVARLSAPPCPAAARTEQPETFQVDADGRVVACERKISSPPS
jgi:hypothetical protein